ncbi:MAG: hypothetical protein M1269_07740 [Chloroflexi bacterium]|nr:hypothetical protein [Chloroflexota bacterium]
MVEKRASICGLINRTLEGASQPLSVEEITVNATQSWGRPFPANQYEPPCLVYKLAVEFCDARIAGESEQILLDTGSDDDKIIFLSPGLSAYVLNKAVEQIKQLKLYKNKEE